MRDSQSESCVYEPDRRYVLRQEVAEGLLYAHSRLNANTTKTLEASSFLYSLIELLGKKGLVSAAHEGMLQVQDPPMETNYGGRFQ